MKYRIIAGKHHVRGENGKLATYNKGDVIESGTRLDRILLNKFQEVPESTPVAHPVPLVRQSFKNFPKDQQPPPAQAPVPAPAPEPEPEPVTRRGNRTR